MSSEQVYLKHNVQIEPLFDSWYVWSHLVPPATAARNITERHIKIMDSYINAPQVHMSAVKNPKLLGGPFIDLGGEHVGDIKCLRDQTKTKMAPLVDLSAALERLDVDLRTNAKGLSLQPLYNNVPDILKGYVELVYDLNDNPSYRIIEPLMYKSKYYDRSAQSLMLSLMNGDDRPFVLSTPRLGTPHSVDLQLPFDDERVDYLFRLKSEPAPKHSIQSQLGLSDEAFTRFETFITPDPPPGYEPYLGNGVRWRYFGHACILIETKDTTLLFDPVLSYTYESDISRYTYLDLPERIDYVLITHNHQDHVLFETLLQLRHKIGTIIVPRNSGGKLQDPSLKLILQNVGFPSVHEISELDSITIPAGRIVGIPFIGEHADLDICTKSGYLVRLGDHTLFFAADSCNIEPMLYKNVHDLLGDVDVLFVGMECDGAPLTWLYGPLLSRKILRAADESRRLAGCDYRQAIDIVQQLNTKEAYVYAMGQEPWLNHVMSLKYTKESRPIVESDRFIGECKDRGICAERLFGEKEILLD